MKLEGIELKTEQRSQKSAMQLSIKNGIGFICVPKCGSTTVERFIRPKSDFSLSGNPQLKHIRYEQVESHVWPLLANLRLRKPFMFAVVREPISWVESWYRFRGRDELSPPDHPQHHNFTGHLSFPEYVEAVLTPKPPSHARIHSQFHYLHNAEGEVGVDQIITLENVDTEVPALLARHNMPIAQPKERQNVSEVRKAAALPENLRQQLLTHLAQDLALYQENA